MDDDALAEAAHETALALPGSEPCQPFGPDHDVYKVRGKVFALLTRVRGPQMVTLKADPPDVVALTRGHAEISPGYHMSKRHWLTLTPGPGIDADLVAELVTTSYLLVVAGLPAAQRPVDPRRFALAVGLAGDGAVDLRAAGPLDGDPDADGDEPEPARR